MPQEEYVVVINKTKVGDPTGVLQFSINNTPMDGLGIQLELSNDNGQKTVIGTTISVPDSNDVILMAPFAVDHAPSGNVSAQITFSGGSYSLKSGAGIDDQFTAAGTNSFIDNNIDVVDDNGLPTFTPPTVGQTKLVAIQCIDGKGNKAFLGQKGSDMYSAELFNNLDIYLTWKVTCVRDQIYNLQNNSSARLEFDSNPNLQLTTTGKSFCISNATPPLYSLRANTSSGAVQFIETQSVNDSYKWYIHDLDRMLNS